MQYKYKMRNKKCITYSSILRIQKTYEYLYRIYEEDIEIRGYCEST